MASKARWHNYVWQLLVATAFTLGVLLLFKGTNQRDVLWALGVSSLASSVFIVFTTPEAQSAKEKTVLAAYFINMAFGATAHYTLRYVLPGTMMLSENGFLLFSIFAAVAVGLSIFVMTILNVKHPPAVGICIILTIDMKRYYIIAVIAISALILALLHLLLKRWLRPL